MIKAVIMALIYVYGVFLIAQYLSRPVVYESWSERKCAFIELADGSRHSCEGFDPAVPHIHQWSK